MCTYIAVMIGPDADAARLRFLASEHGLGWEEMHNRSLLAQAPGSKWFLTSGAGCNCGTRLVSADPSSAVEDRSAKVLSLRRRGWSEPKIARWLEEKTSMELRRQHARERVPGEADVWLSFLRAAVVSSLARRVGILIHD